MKLVMMQFTNRLYVFEKLNKVQLLYEKQDIDAWDKLSKVLKNLKSAADQTEFFFDKKSEPQEKY